jgi:hypothetical protein
MHAIGIRGLGGQDIPCQFPHDAFKHDSSGSGKQFIELYRQQGVNALVQTFSNPPAADGKPGGNSVEVGLHWMLTKMQEGKLKVFKGCNKWIQEKATYHRDKGKVVALDDDMISASRYAFLTIDRFGQSVADSRGSKWDSADWEPEWWGGIV